MAKTSKAFALPIAVDSVPVAFRFPGQPAVQFTINFYASTDGTGPALDSTAGGDATVTGYVLTPPKASEQPRDTQEFPSVVELPQVPGLGEAGAPIPGSVDIVVEGGVSNTMQWFPASRTAIALWVTAATPAAGANSYRIYCHQATS